MTLSHDVEGLAASNAAMSALDVQHDLLLEVQAVLLEGETVAGFIEDTLRKEIRRRSFEFALTRRADASWQEYQRTGISFPASVVFDEVEERVARRRKELGG